MANKMVLVVAEEVVGTGTVDSSELDDEDKDADVSTIVCDSILDAPVNFCGVNASTKQLLRRSLLCINIAVTHSFRLFVRSFIPSLW